MDTTTKSRRAIGSSTRSTLRYSRDPPEPLQPLYRLGPIEAYDLRLVKRIEVASIKADDDFSDAYVKPLKTDNTNGIRAQLEIHRAGAGSAEATKVWVKQGDDLFQLSERALPLSAGLRGPAHRHTPGYETVEFNQGRFLELGQASAAPRPTSCAPWSTRPSSST